MGTMAKRSGQHENKKNWLVEELIYKRKINQQHFYFLARP
jgi:hypothetical protein